MVCEREKMIEKLKDPVAKVVRKLTPDDKKRLLENEQKNHQSHNVVMGKIEDHELDMKLTCVQYTFDRAKLFIFLQTSARPPVFANGSTSLETNRMFNGLDMRPCR